jgi:hypothetical protein
MTALRRIGVLLTGMAALVAGASARGDDAARAALDKARALNRGERHWADRRQRMTLTIVDRRGSEYRRELEVVSKRADDDATRSLMFFHAPAQVAGSASCSGPIRAATIISGSGCRRSSAYARSAAARAARASSARTSATRTSRSWPRPSIGRRTRQPVRVGEEAVDGVACDVIELRPTAGADVDYGTVRLWLGRDDQTVRKFEFRDADGTLAKTLLLSEIRAEKNIPTAHHLEMRNEKTGSHTNVVVSELTYDTGIADEEFTQRRLEKGL